MKYNSETNEILGSDGRLIKRLFCPQDLSADDLQMIEGTPDRYCEGCDKQIRCIDGMSEEAVREIVDGDSNACVFAMAGGINMVGDPVCIEDIYDDQDIPKLRVIKTARGISAINTAAREGYRPLVRKVEPSLEIRQQLEVAQNPLTGEVEAYSDYRSTCSPGFERILPFFFYRPGPPEEPVAAYLIPYDLVVGERVLLKDLIEDVVRYSQQDSTFRLASCEATWDGEGFVLHIPEQKLVFG
jgi:hypothetical protein